MSVAKAQIFSLVKEVKETSDYEKYRKLYETGNWIILDFVINENGFRVSLGRIN